MRHGQASGTRHCLLRFLGPPAPADPRPALQQRPPGEREDRAVAGQWKGDLVERTSRHLAPVPLTGADALTVGDAAVVAIAAVTKLPERPCARAPRRPGTRPC